MRFKTSTCFCQKQSSNVGHFNDQTVIVIHIGHTKRVQIQAPTSDCNITYKVVTNDKNKVRMNIDSDYLVVFIPLMTLSESFTEIQEVIVMHKGIDVASFKVPIRIDLPENPCELEFDQLWHMRAKIGDTSQQKIRVKFKDVRVSDHEERCGPINVLI